VAALATELRARLSGARLRALFLDPGGRSALLFLRDGTLAVRFHPVEAGITLLGPSEPLPGARSLPAVLADVEAPPDDRVLRFHFRGVRGPHKRLLLALELLPNRWNAVWAEGESARIRHALIRREGERPVRPGLPYVPPPPSRREGSDGALPPERWRSLLLPLPPESRRGVLLQAVAWTSPLNADALLGSAAREDGAAAEGALARGYELWARLVAATRAPEPGVLRPDGALQPYPLPLPGVAWAPEPGLLEAFAAATAAAGRPGDALLPSEWLQALESHADRLAGRAARLEEELAAAPEPAALRAAGDLLLARYADVPRGASAAALVDFDGRPVQVALDPALAPHENATRYYERAGRAERARERLPALVRRARESASRAERLLARARAGEAGVEEVRAELPARPETPPVEGSPVLPYRTYRSSGGLEIRVGRGARRNDELTFHHAAPDDVWLHARHAAGAHVVLRWQGEGNPPAKDLAEAAALAALNSRARGSRSVPVDWTRRKYVRKPRKAPPGTVVIERAQTLFVEPDARLEERLAEEGEQG
jgi:predicted ribosome quality control (RQC) complex YloA/Tae2 family protein